MTTIRVSNPVSLYPKGDSAYVLAVAGGYVGTQEDFEADLNLAINNVDESSASAAAALLSEQHAKTSEDNADADATQTALDRIATGQDRVATGQDKSATNADATQTALDRIATGQDRSTVAADKLTIAADKSIVADDKLTVSGYKDTVAADKAIVIADMGTVAADKAIVSGYKDTVVADAAQTALDRIATAADRVQTGLDKSATNADVVLTHADVVLTHADQSTVAADKATTAGYKDTATTQAGISTAQAVIATAQAVAAAASAAAAALGASQVAKGNWDALTNTPTLANGIGTAGWWYIVSTAGTSLSQIFAVGDMIFYNGSTWVLIASYKTIASMVEAMTGVDNTKYITADLLYFINKLNQVPYQGAIDDLNLGAFTAKANIIESPKVKTTIEGGIAIKMTNKTGGASVKGTIVAASTGTDNAFMNNPIDGDMPIGIIYDSGIADGSECWVVVSGIAEVLIKDSTAVTRGYVAYSSATTAGRMDISATAPAATTHFREIGHTLESKVSGTGVLAKCILHFN